MSFIKRPVALVLTFSMHMVNANPIFYEVENLGGATWQYTYHVGNSTAGPLDVFSIFFDPNLYSFDLVSGMSGFEVDPGTYAGPLDWDISVAPPDPFFPGPSDDQPGIYNGSALGAPVNVGDLLAGFTMTFEWLGPGTPGSQPFTLFGTDLLPVLGDNFFTQPLRVVGINEPGSFTLVAVLLIIFLRGQRQTQTMSSAVCRFDIAADKL